MGVPDFKKATPKGAPSRISGSDAKRLRAEAAKTLRATDESIDAILPKNAVYEMVKMSNRAVVYLVDGQPMFVDGSGRWELFPTVYALWAIGESSTLTTVRTHSLVSPKVLGGAALMLPGMVVSDDNEKWASNELVAVGVVGNDDAFAVGVMACSSAEATANGMKGVGAEIAHMYGDAVWALGDKSTPSTSFSLKRIYPSGEEAPKEEQIFEETVPAMESLTIDVAREVEQESFDVSTPAKMDAMIDRCFAIGAHKIADDALPMRCENFFANFVLPSRPDSVTLDLKHSTYKKQAKLFSVMEKKGVIKTKLIHKIENVLTINREHELLKKHASTAEPADAGQTAGENAGPPPDLGTAEVEIKRVYRASTMYRPIFGAQALENKERLYSKSECKKALCEYVRSNGLGEGVAGSEVKLDTLLGKELFAKKEEWYGTDSMYPIEDLFERLMGKLQVHTAVRMHRNGETLEYVKKGSIRPVVIKAEDRGRRKYITKVSGIETFCIKPDEFADVLKKQFSASVSVDDLPGKQETGKELSIQGHVVMQLAELLQKNMGVPSKYIDAQN